MAEGTASEGIHFDGPSPLAGKVAVVTGGSRGIGAAICRLFARRGAKVVTTYNTHPEEAERVVADMRRCGHGALALKVDVAEREQVAYLIETAVQEMGAVDIVVANAAVNHRYPVAEAPWDAVKRTVDVTMWGVFHSLQFGAQQMLRQGRGGRLIAISSIHAEVPFANSGAYNMAKAGINHLCRTMARELAPYGITVNSIEPGWIDTEGERDRHTEEQLVEGAKRIPAGRMGRPEEVAGLALYLASADAAYVTGSVFRIDGGMTLVN